MGWGVAGPGKGWDISRGGPGRRAGEAAVCPCRWEAGWGEPSCLSRLRGPHCSSEIPELANHSANSWLFPASPTTGRASCSDKTALGQLSFGRLVLPCLPIYLVTRMRRQVWTCHSITLPAWNAASNTISDQTPRPLPIVCLCPFLPESVKIMFSLFIIKQMLICFNL